jgi:hypothetical protein
MASKRKKRTDVNVNTRKKKNNNRKNISVNVNDIRCQDISKCLALGIETHEINSYFDHFNNFTYMTAIKHIDTSISSSNGNIRILSFGREHLNTHTLFKTSKLKHSDNLYYEHSVGLYINSIITLFPCFIHTYGVFYTDNSKYIRLDDEIQLNVACRIPLQLSLMTQYISPNISLGKYMKNQRKMKTKMMSNLTHILFQVYGPLVLIRDKFTHYDLHDQNVILYQLPDNQCIEMEYIYRDYTVRFKTNVIVKIIDYGRSFFSKNIKIRKQVCLEKACNRRDETCGTHVGFSFLKKRSKENVYWINTYEKNNSHDLRLTQFVKRYLSNRDEPLYSVIKRIYYKDFYGTPENLNPSEHIIYNITSFHNQITAIMMSNPFITENQYHHDSMTCIGKMIITMDGKHKMQFISY